MTELFLRLYIQKSGGRINDIKMKIKNNQNIIFILAFNKWNNQTAFSHHLLQNALSGRNFMCS